jgi:hypothetical protein
VGTLCALDTLSLVLWGYAIYWYLILNFGNLTATTTGVLSSAAEPLITGVIALAVHLFLAWRIQILDKDWRNFTIVLAVASFASVSSTIAATVIEVNGIQKGLSVSDLTKAAGWCTILGDVFSAVVDVAIAGSIVYLLHRGRGRYTATNRLVNGLTLYIVASGLITAIIRVAELILNFAYPNTLYFIIPYISTSKAYTNAL